MTRKTHEIGGVLFGILSLPIIVIVAAFIGISIENEMINLLIILFSMIGSTLPDIDEPNSYMGRKLWFISRPVRAIQRILVKGNKNLGRLLGHRGITHSIFFWMVFLLIGYAVHMFIDLPFENVLVSQFILVFFLGITIGALSHIFFDMLNPSGVPIFLPFSKKRYKIPLKITTGSKQENIFAVFALLVTLGVGYQMVKDFFI